MFIKLSYNLSESTPFYSAMPGPSLDQIYDIGKGDPCNSFYFTSSNHAGTHVDGPRHFNSEGRRIAEYDLSELIFERVAVIDIEAPTKHLIMPEDLAVCAALPDDCELLLLRTGFSRFRADATKYVEESPGFSKAAAYYLIDRFKNLKALAVDFVSIAAMAHMDEGCEAHRVFLGCKEYSERTVLLVEDARLPQSLPQCKRAFLIPWFFDGLDSAPCTLFAEV